MIGLEEHENILAKARVEVWKEGHWLCFTGYRWLKKLPTLPQNLTHLEVSRTNFLSLPECLPSTITHLRCSENYVKKLPRVLPLALVNMSIWNTDIKILPPLPSKLYMLDIGFTKIKSLPTLPNTIRYLYTEALDDIKLEVIDQELPEDLQWYTHYKTIKLRYEKQQIIEHNRKVTSVQRERCIARCKRIRDELMEVTWNPDRPNLLQWCGIGDDWNIKCK